MAASTWVIGGGGTTVNTVRVMTIPDISRRIVMRRQTLRRWNRNLQLENTLHPVITLTVYLLLAYKLRAMTACCRTPSVDLRQLCAALPIQTPKSASGKVTVLSMKLPWHQAPLLSTTYTPLAIQVI